MKTLTKLSIPVVLFFGLFHSSAQAYIYVPSFNLTINQHAIIGDDNFAFKIAGSYVNESGPSPDLTQTLNIETVNGVGTNTDFYRFFGLYQSNLFYLTQDNKVGWNSPTVECHSDDPLVVITSIENGVLINAQDGADVRCDFTNTKKNNGNSSVLFLPGIEGSRLYKEISVLGLPVQEKLWEPNGALTDINNLLMDENGKATRDDIYTKDIIDNAFIPTQKGDVYKSFISQLDSMKNTEHIIHDYSVIPYDWRLSIDDILNNGKKDAFGRIYYSGTSGQTENPYIIQELRRLASESDTGKVTIIAHSTGGLITEALTNKLGPEASQLIDKIIFVAVPQVGTPSAVGALLHGVDQGLPRDWLSFIGISKSTVREIGQNMPEPYNLLPSSNYFTYVDDPVITFDKSPLLAPWRGKYGSTIHSSETMHNFLTDQSRITLPTETGINSPLILNNLLLNKSEGFHAVSDNWIPPAGVQLTEIAGWGNSTLKTLSYYEGKSCKWISSIQCLPVPVLQFKPETVIDGDGTVLEPSALWTPVSDSVKRYWLDLKSYNSSGILGSTINRDHATIFEVPQLRELFKDIITNDTTVLPEFISTSAPQNPNLENRLHFILHSPLSLDLYDDQGNHTGYLSDGTLEENILGSEYKTFGEVKFISVPVSSNLHLVMKGYDKGSFTLDIDKVQGDTTINTTTFAAVPTTPSTVATLDVSKDVVITPLSVDEDGNGTADIILTPKVGEVVIPDFVPPLTVASVSATAGLNGWYISDASIYLNAKDDDTGVNKTLYSLDNGATYNTYISTFTISKEGINNIIYYSIDNNGNKEDAKTLLVKIDKTPPESHITFDKSTKKINITSSDDSSGATVNINNTSSIITDGAGNTLTLNISKNTTQSNSATLVIPSFSYSNGINTNTLTSLRYFWATNPKTDKYTLLISAIKTPTERLVSIYSQATNKTYIVESNQNDDNTDLSLQSALLLLRKKLKTYDGMVIPHVSTDKGKFVVGY